MLHSLQHREKPAQPIGQIGRLFIQLHVQNLLINMYLFFLLFNDIAQQIGFNHCSFFMCNFLLRTDADFYLCE